MNEAETCRTMVRPRLEAAGWLANGERFFREQMHITHGRIVLAGGKPKRQKRKIPDFLLYFTRDILLAVVEAKSDQRPADVGLQQAKEYAQLLGLKFAYRSDSATFRARLLSMTPGELTAASFGRAMGIPLHRNIGELFALVEPSPPRLTEDEFVVIPTCRWLTRAAREEGVPLNEDTLRFLLGEVAGVLKRTVPELMALPLDEFDQLRRDAAKATPADKKRVREGGRPKLGEGPKATPQDVALRNVYELIRAAKQDGWGVKALMKHFTEDKAFRGRVRDAGEVWGSALFKNAIAWISDNPEQETQAVNVS